MTTPTAILVQLPTIHMMDQREMYVDVSGPIVIRGIPPSDRDLTPARSALITQVGEFVVDLPAQELARQLNELRVPGSKIRQVKKPETPKKD